MTVKANQPRLYADLALLFKRPTGPNQDLRFIEHTSKAHGRLETRSLWASTDLQGYEVVHEVLVKWELPDNQTTRKRHERHLYCNNLRDNR